MESLPGCVLISVIAPAFVSERPADLLALVVTLVAASRLPILPTVLIGIASAGAPGGWLGGVMAGGAGGLAFSCLGGGGGEWWGDGGWGGRRRDVGGRCMITKK